MTVDEGNHYEYDDGRRPYFMEMDHYQHPEKRNNPKLRYSRGFDIYSLGCVLLEIAFWQPLSKLAQSDAEPEAFTRELQDRAKQLPG